MPVTIKVSQKFIDEGLRTNCRLCPVALAINDVLKDNYYCLVASITTIKYYGDTKEKYSTYTPTAAVNFYHRYDDLRDVEPIEFEMDIPEEFLKA